MKRWYWDGKRPKSVEDQQAQEYLRLQNRLRGEPETEIVAPDWPFVLTKQDERFLTINRIAR